MGTKEGLQISNLKRSKRRCLEKSRMKISRTAADDEYAASLWGML
jgi:hypothetical protein